ncbi:MAG: hypothetical protein IJM51_04640 [Clostridia bacterium]|nr:hypothetical protein [Clostridia bacterium]
MKETKRGHRAQPSKKGVLRSAKKKIIDSTDFIKDQQYGLIESFRGAKTTTKVVISVIVIACLLLGTVSATHSLNSIAEKEKRLARLDREIALQKAENEQIEQELQGDYDELVEYEAHERLEMLYPDELLFINKAG